MTSEKLPEEALCFVCRQKITTQPITLNIRLNLPVCELCYQTKAEKKAEIEALESLGEDFVCGCI